MINSTVRYAHYINNNIANQIDSAMLLQSGTVCGMILCIKGRISVSLQGEEVKLQSNNMLLYLPNSNVHILNMSEGCEAHILEADIHTVLPTVQRVLTIQNLQTIREQPISSITEGKLAETQRHIQALYSCYTEISENDLGEDYEYLNRTILAEETKVMFCSLMRVFFSSNKIVSARPPSHNDTVYYNFLLSLYQNYKRERDVTFYAELQHMTPRHFSQIIKMVSGRPVLPWITDMVINEAKQLLGNKELSIKEIAEQLNFSTQTFFCKYFKQYTNQTPSEFRHNN